MLLASLLLPLAFAPPEGDLAAVQEIFDESCTLCHDASDDMLNLEDPSALVGRPSTTGMALIEPGKPNESYLYLKMVAAEGIEGESMPMGDDPLPVEQLSVVQSWIASLPPAEDAPPAGEGTDEAGEAAPAPAGEAGEGMPVPPADTPIVPPKRKPKQPFFGSHQINLQTTTTLGKKTISFRIHHRFGLVGTPGDRNYLGMANGAVMSMGAEYGIIDGLDVLARWTTARLGWELGLKYVPIRQEEGMPLSFGVYASGEALTTTTSSSANRFTGNFQVMLSRLWFERWSTQLTVNYSALTNHAPSVSVDIDDDGVADAVTDDRGTLNLGLASTLWLGKKRKHGIDLEYQLPIPSDVFYYNGGNANPNGSKVGSWALGWSARTGLHVFQVFVTNTRNIHTNLVAPGGDTKNPFSPFGEFFFGFNITRKWKL
ncbi:hypothetical protein G6O69_03630 [Pseudenhygromyxa sp. WMMC2535]|uniref:DUF5777 family beta-barrel protein n=1 Tax=Pseudenhygromyxa sp. WMMC2535 TaxID=2712867 RepID=UPI0015545B19|nr:DUF5777 family beta-barrel protein [Pseudenhygromyxa sp. WMMC2535]NVB36906.1 hypothetical protein [Pseudenhygromyxa sp. WMMC2535]